jgi:hypothetical protein
MTTSQYNFLHIVNTADSVSTPKKKISFSITRNFLFFHKISFQKSLNILPFFLQNFYQNCRAAKFRWLKTCTLLGPLVHSFRIVPDHFPKMFFRNKLISEQRGQQNIVQSCWATGSAFFAVYNNMNFSRCKPFGLCFVAYNRVVIVLCVTYGT